MAYTVDRVVVCDAYQEPERHYRLLPGGRSELVDGRRPSMRFLASAKDAKSGIAGVVGREAALFDDLGAADEERNEFVNDLRGEVRSWREAGYPGTAVVTRRLLEWWFERDEERRAVGKRLFFCQQEAVETLIHLYEVQRRHRMPGTGDLLRYALKLATGAGKTVVMATIVVWSTLHKRKVSGSSLSANFLVLVPNLTVRDRVSGAPRGDGLDPAGERNLYDEFEMVPPEYRHEFQPNVLVRNWQAVPLDAKRDDWIGEGEVPVEDGRFVPQSVLRAMRRRARQDPNAPIRRLLKGWRDLVVFNDEAHHVYGEKRTKKGEEPAYIRWSHILDRITKSARRSSRRAGSKRPASEGLTSACSSVAPWDDRWNRRFGTGTTSCSAQSPREHARAGSCWSSTEVRPIRILAGRSPLSATGRRNGGCPTVGGGMPG